MDEIDERVARSTGGLRPRMGSFDRDAEILKGRIAGLKEAAEIAEEEHLAPVAARRIRARISELENP